MYLIKDWFSGVIFYMIFIFIFCLFYFGIHIILLPTIINRLIHVICNFTIRRGVERAIKSEDDVQYRKLLIQNALSKVKYGDVNEKRLGMKQLEQLSEELDHFESKYAYKALSNILKSESDWVYAKLIIGNLNKSIRYRIEHNLIKSIEKEEYSKYQKMLIENALKKAKSSDEDERKTGLEQLSQFGTEDTYERLLEILKNTKLNKSHEKQIIKTLYKILNNIKNMNK